MQDLINECAPLKIDNLPPIFAVNRTMNETILFYLHIPKTAGRSFSTILKRQFTQDTMIRVRNNGPEDLSNWMEEVKSMPLDQKEKIRCVWGHMPFGLHTLFPQRPTYITFLRHPVDRIISHYYFVKRRTQHHLHQEVVSKNLDLVAYATSDISPELQNGQTRLLSGNERDTPTSETLELAKENLSKCFSFCGVTERFGESLVLLKKKFNWVETNYERRNVTENRPYRNRIPNEVSRTICEVNYLDIELYRFAERLFENSISTYGKRFGYDLWLFRIQNRLQQLYSTNFDKNPFQAVLL